MERSNNGLRRGRAHHLIYAIGILFQTCMSILRMWRDPCERQLTLRRAVDAVLFPCCAPLSFQAILGQFGI